MTNQTIEKLYGLRLNTMAVAFKEQLEEPSMAGLAFEERMAIMVDREWTFRENRRLQKLLKEAKLKQQATIEDIDYRYPRELDKSIILSLTSCQWVRSHQNVLLTGPTGIGKSFIAEALANKACREGFTSLRIKSTKLFHELAIARGDGSYIKYVNKLAKTDLLFIDDWGLPPLAEVDRIDMLDIIEDRYLNRSTIITSQYPVVAWYNLIGEPTVADAILDRILHNAHKIALKGESMRKNMASDLTQKCN